MSAGTPVTAEPETKATMAIATKSSPTATTSFAGVGISGLMDLKLFEPAEEKYTPPTTDSGNCGVAAATAALQGLAVSNSPNTTSTSQGDVQLPTATTTAASGQLAHNFTIIKGNYCGNNLSSANQVQPASILSKCESVKRTFDCVFP